MNPRPHVGVTFDWGDLGRCTVVQVHGQRLHFKAANGCTYQIGVRYWQRMADNVTPAA